MNVEHSPAGPSAPSRTDGACFTILCQAKEQTLRETSSFHWLQMDDHSMVETLTTALTQKLYCTQMIDI